MINEILKLFNRKSCHLTYLVLAIGFIQSCTPLLIGYGPDGQSREEFERRVEAAFRLQNKMTSEVMVIQSDGSNPKQHEPIIQAEQVMEKNCAPLNEYASRDIDGQSKSLILLKQVENAVVVCESSAQKVEELLKKHQR